MTLRGTIVLLTLAGVQAGCFLFSDEGRPCDEGGRCLPGYVCVEGVCQEAAVIQLGEECLATGECVDGAVCATPLCDDSDQLPCTADADCGEHAPEEVFCYAETCRCRRTCRPGCNKYQHAECGELSGLLCWYDPSQERGFCAEGYCGRRDDGTELGSCAEGAYCLVENGPGSGQCVALCDVLAQESCAPDYNCEHVELLMIDPLYSAYGICLPSGQQTEGGSCVPGNADCQRGLVCHERSCVRYCNLQDLGASPTCTSGYTCTAFTGGALLPYGWCR